MTEKYPVHTDNGVIKGQQFPAVSYERVPPHMRAAMYRYIEYGLMPGDFLRAVLRNDFVHAFMYADEVNQQNITAYFGFLYWDAPPGCWGSLDKMRHWCEEQERATKGAEDA